MVYFNASNPLAGTAYYDIIIDDPLLTEYGFTKFSLPLNDNAIKMILYNDKDPSMITYVDIDKHNLDKTVNLLKDKLSSERKIDKEIAQGLGAYLRNACICRIEDPDSDLIVKQNRNSKDCNEDYPRPGHSGSR